MSAIQKNLLISIMLMAIIFPVMGNAADYTWTGAVNNNWSEPGNWTSIPTGTYPGVTDKAVIPGGKANYPLLTSPSGSVGDLIVENGASLTINNGTGYFQIITSATINGSLRIDSGKFIPMKSTVGAGGTLTVSGGSFYIGMNGAIIVAGGTLALNSGEIVCDYNSILENNGTITVSGGNVKPISVNYCVINNNSLMEITGNASGEKLSFTNSPGGVFELKPGSMLSITGDNGGKFDNYGVMEGNGFLRFSPFPPPPPPPAPPSTPLTFKNFGTIKPGGPLNVGSITIDGKYEQMPGGTLEIEIFNSGMYDKLAVNGDAAFNGTLAVSFLAGAMFGTDEIYDIVS